MEQYISKSALVAEIIRRRKAIPKEEDDKRLKAVYGNEAFVLTELLEYIDTLEVKEVEEEPVSEELDEAADNAFNKVLNTDQIVNVRSCIEMFKYGAQWKEKETLQEVKEKLLYMLNTSIDNKHFFEQLDDYIDELENKQ